MANLLKALILLSTVSTVLALTQGITTLDYNCDRNRESACNPSVGSCLSTGQCACVQGFNGNDCTIPGTFVPDNCDCEHGGTCYVDVFNVQRCACTESWLGEKCEICRVNLECTLTSMTFTLYAQNPGFIGFLEFLTGAGGRVTTCNRQPDLGTGGQRFTLNLNTGGLAGTPGACDAAFFTQGTNKCYRMMLVYNPNLLTSTDEQFFMCCTEDGNVVQNTLTVGLGNLPTISVFQSVPIATGVFVFTSGGRVIPPNEPVELSTDISYRIDKADAGGADFKVTSCHVLNGASSNIVIINNGCPSTDLLAIVKAIRRSSQTGTVHIDLSAFIPTDASLLEMICTVESCLGQCSYPPCPDGIYQEFGRRRRRQADGNDTSIQAAETSATISVRLRGDMPYMTCPAQKPCGLPSAFTPVAAVFGVLLVAALAVAICICVRVSRRTTSAAEGVPKA